MVRKQSFSDYACVMSDGFASAKLRTWTWTSKDFTSLVSSPQAISGPGRLLRIVEGLISYSQFFAGDFIKETGPDRTIRFVALELLFKF